MLIFEQHFLSSLLVPFPPSGLNIESEFHYIEETLVTLVVQALTAAGLAAIFDNYIISISPSPPHHPDYRILAPDNSFNVSLVHNVVYAFNVTTVNCYGESQPLLQDIEFGM